MTTERGKRKIVVVVAVVAAMTLALSGGVWYINSSLANADGDAPEVHKVTFPKGRTVAIKVNFEDKFNAKVINATSILTRQATDEVAFGEWLGGVNPSPRITWLHSRTPAGCGNDICYYVNTCYNVSQAPGNLIGTQLAGYCNGSYFDKNGTGTADVEIIANIPSELSHVHAKQSSQGLEFTKNKFSGTWDLGVKPWVWHNYTAVLTWS